jgi:tRNA (guanine37-N1)-methyltransferase
MRIDVITIFPEFFTTPLDCSILARARQLGAVTVGVHNLRDYTEDKHRVVDDYPYGGGAGMVLKPEPLAQAVEALLDGAPVATPVILLTPQGRRLNHKLAGELAREEHLILICGHYEGVDERVRRAVVTDELSVGDYVLTGGEPAALIVVDAVTRLVPGVVGNPDSVVGESFATGLLEYPHYTRPAEWRGMAVPEVLLSGHHENIRRWRRKQALSRTRERRADLLAEEQLTKEDLELLAELDREMGPGAGEENPR